MKPKNLEQCIKMYGTVSPGKWELEHMWMTVWTAPKWFSDQVLNGLTGKPCLRIYMNRDIIAPWEQALANLKKNGCLQELKSFDGCFNLRDKRGLPGQPSLHSWGLALDLNAPQNPLGGESKFSEGFVKSFKDAGFVWGGDFKRKDPMHFQYADF